MRRSRQAPNHDNRTRAPRRRSSCSDPLQSHQAVAHLLGAQSQNQAQDWKGLGKIFDSDDGEESSDPLEVRAGTHVSSHRYTHATQLDPHSTHTLERPRRQQRGTLKAGGVGIDDWGFWQAFRASIQEQLWQKAARHELGAGLEGGADFTTLFKHDKFLERRGLHAARGILLAAATASC